MAGEFAGKAAIKLVDIDKSPELAEKYGVQAIPMTFIFKDGQESGKVLGAVSSEVKGKIEAAL